LIIASGALGGAATFLIDIQRSKKKFKFDAFMVSSALGGVAVFVLCGMYGAMSSLDLAHKVADSQLHLTLGQIIASGRNSPRVSDMTPMTWGWFMRWDLYDLLQVGRQFVATA
jgi:hypothetical protein